MIFPETPQDGFLPSDPQLRFSEMFYLLLVTLWEIIIAIGQGSPEKQNE